MNWNTLSALPNQENLVCICLKETYPMMKLQEAIRLRDEWREKLTGKPFTAKDSSWQIKDVIVSNKKHVMDIYKKMYHEVQLC